MTTAPDEDPDPPRHCREDMVLVSGAEGRRLSRALCLVHRLWITTVGNHSPCDSVTMRGHQARGYEAETAGLSGGCEDEAAGHDGQTRGSGTGSLDRRQQPGSS